MSNSCECKTCINLTGACNHFICKKTNKYLGSINDTTVHWSFDITDFTKYPCYEEVTL